MRKKRSLRQWAVDTFSDASPFMTRVGQGCVLCIFNLLWLVCCLPIVTAGAASAALAEVLLRFPAQSVGSAFTEFFRALARHLRTATPVWLLLLALGAVLAADWRFLLARGLTESLPAMAGFLLPAVLYLFLLVWVFPVLAVPGGGMGSVLRTAVVLAVAYLGRSLAAAALALLPLGLALFYAAWFARLAIFWLLIGFALIAWGQSLLIRGPLRRYAERQAREWPPPRIGAG